MLPTVLACLLLASGVSGNWEDKSHDPDNWHLGFKFYNLECNADGTSCFNSYKVNIWGSEVQQNFTYNKSPSEVFFTGHAEWGDDVAVSLKQGNEEQFRICYEYELFYDLNDGPPQDHHKVRKCLENTFEGITVPPECVKPVALKTVYIRVGDREIRGAEVLYCTGVEKVDKGLKGLPSKAIINA